MMSREEREEGEGRPIRKSRYQEKHRRGRLTETLTAMNTPFLA